VYPVCELGNTNSRLYQALSATGQRRCLIGETLDLPRTAVRFPRSLQTSTLGLASRVLQSTSRLAYAIRRVFFPNFVGTGLNSERQQK
jgi:hypothetical protein